MPYQVVLVLDDYQFVTEEDSHESVAFFVEHLPENVHLVISSRTDPPLPLGRLRARGELNEIRTEQLAFSEEEAECLLNEKMGLDIGPDDLCVLLERTEGWPAGIYLASLSLQNKEDKHAFIESFRGSNRYIVGLLGEEVLAGLTEEVRQFLLETSVLRTMTGPLCDAVTGRQGSARLLRELARSNLFVVSLDEQGEWYRYHHLFSELLLYELKSSRPDLVPTLRRRASVWLEDAGYFEGAIRQAIAATDYERVGLLIARHWYGYVLSRPDGDGGTVARVVTRRDDHPRCGARPGEGVDLRPRWPARGEREISGARREPPLRRPASRRNRLGRVGSGHPPGRLRLRWRPGPWSRRSSSAAELESERKLAVGRVGALRAGTLACIFPGDTSRARKPLEEASSTHRGSASAVVRIGHVVFLSFVATDEGHLEEAESLAREAHSAGGKITGYKDSPVHAGAPSRSVVRSQNAGKLEEAQEELESGLSARQRLPGLSPWPTLIGLLALAPVRPRVATEPEQGGARRGSSHPGGLSRRRHVPRAARAPGTEASRAQAAGGTARRGAHGARARRASPARQASSSTRQMAQSLYVAPSTVRTQIKSIYRKLGVSSRGAAVEEAQRQGAHLAFPTSPQIP